MTTNRRVGYGHVLSVDSANGTSFTPLGNIVDGWKGPEGKKTVIDITLLSDTDMAFGVGQKDNGEVTFSLMYDPDDSQYTVLKTLYDQQTQVPANWQVTYTRGVTGSGTITTETFHGHVVGLSKEVKKTEYLKCTVTIKVTGSI